MGEYYLECGPEDTKPELKEVIKFIENPIFTSSIINGEHIKYFVCIGLLLGSIILGNLAYTTSNSMKFDWWIKFGCGVLSIIFLILFMLISTDILDVNSAKKGGYSTKKGVNTIN